MRDSGSLRTVNEGPVGLGARGTASCSTTGSGLGFLAFGVFLAAAAFGLFLAFLGGGSSAATAAAGAAAAAGFFFFTGLTP